MKKLVTILFLFIISIGQAQKVVKPMGNKKEKFSLTINKQPYQIFIGNFINKSVYKSMWVQLLKKQSEEQGKALREQILTASIILMIDVTDNGLVNITNSGSSCNNEIGEGALKNVLQTICDDLMKEIKKSGIVTPSYNKIMRSYMSMVQEVSKTWKVTL